MTSAMRSPWSARSGDIAGAPSRGDLVYLPALDGLRAVAVALVVAYHLDLGIAAGGFLGVDLFFVISGFLITSLLIREHAATGRISLRSFWTRRFRRLVPPLVVMIAATLSATRLFGLPEQWSSIRSDAAAALGYLANWRFVTTDQSYFEALLGPSPLRHTWSLAVEEQWYLLWPLAVIALLLLASRGPRLARLPLLLIGAGAIGSAALMAALHQPADPTRVYFGTDTRAQQLLVGAALAWVVSRRSANGSGVSSRWAGAMTTGSFGAFLAIALTTSDEAPWLYRGGFLFVSLLAAVVVWSVSTPGRHGPLGCLGAPAFVWLGTRSYGAYLWHWPVIVFVGRPMGIDLARLPLAVLQVLLTLALAELSFRLVERPIRTSTWRPTPVIGGWTVISVTTIVVAAVVLVPPEGRNLDADTAITPSIRPSTSAPPVPLVSEIPPTAGASRRSASARAGSAPDESSAGTTPVPSLQPPVRPTVLVLGDSTALKMIDSMDPERERSWNVEGVVNIGCAITPGRTLDVGADVGTVRAAHCDEWRSEWSRWKEYVDPDVTVVMIGAWEVLDHLVGDAAHRFPDDGWFSIVRSAVGEALDIAGANGTPVAVMELPCMRQAVDADPPARARNDGARIDAFNDILAEAVAARPDAWTLDLPGLLCPDGVFLEEVGGQPVRYDGVHVTPAGAELVVNWLTGQLDERLSAPPVRTAPAS